MMGSGWGIGAGSMLLGWLLVVVAIVVVAGWLSRGASRGRAGGEDGALALLRERYARGEIAKEEFDARRRDLA